VLIKDVVEWYEEDPNPFTVEMSWAEEIYDAVPNPIAVERNPFE
jgi:hypothetical protein